MAGEKRIKIDGQQKKVSGEPEAMKQNEVF